MNKYKPLLRPASFATLPGGVKWEYVEVPDSLNTPRWDARPHSRHRYGVISTDRPLTAEECERFDLEPVP